MEILINERIECEECGKKTAVLASVARTEDRNGPTDLLRPGRTVYLNERLLLDYECRNCKHESRKTIGGL